MFVYLFTDFDEISDNEWLALATLCFYMHSRTENMTTAVVAVKLRLHAARSPPQGGAGR